MSRLYDVNVDEKRWKVNQINEKGYPSYRLIDKDNDEIYTFNHIIGIEQVNDNELLVFRSYSWDDFQLIRYRLQHSIMRQVFETKLSHFEFLTDDRILFTYRDKGANKRILGVYSISENKMVEDTKWINSSIIKSIKKNEDKKIILLEKDLVFEDIYLLFALEASTLEPCSSCYSSFRNDYIDVNSKEDILSIKKEDEMLARMIEKFKFEQKQKRLKKANDKILKNI